MSQGRSQHKLSYGAVAAVVILLIASFVAFMAASAVLLQTKKVMATVTGRRWSREIEVKTSYPLVQQLPSYAFKMEACLTWSVENPEQWAVDSIERETTMARGERPAAFKLGELFLELSPSLASDCWILVRHIRGEARNTKPMPFWPPYTLGSGEKEIARHENYIVELKGNDKFSYLCAIDFDKWLTVREGITRPLRVRVTNGIADCRRFNQEL